MGTGKGLQGYRQWYDHVSHPAVHRLFQHILHYRLTYFDTATESTVWQQTLKYLIITRPVWSSEQFNFFMNSSQIHDTNCYLVVVQYLAWSQEDLQGLVSVLHRFLAIPVLCTLGSRAAQHHGASSVPGWPQSFQQKLGLCVRCTAPSTLHFSVHRPMANICKNLNVPMWIPSTPSPCFIASCFMTICFNATGHFLGLLNLCPFHFWFKAL